MLPVKNTYPNESLSGAFLWLNVNIADRGMADRNAEKVLAIIIFGSPFSPAGHVNAHIWR